MNVGWLAGILGALCVGAIVLIVVAPWRRVRAERPLDDSVETRLLLGEDPEEVGADADAAEADALAHRPDPPVELPRRQNP